MTSVLQLLCVLLMMCWRTGTTQKSGGQPPSAWRASTSSSSLHVHVTKLCKMSWCPADCMLAATLLPNLCSRQSGESESQLRCYKDPTDK